MSSQWRAAFKKFQEQLDRDVSRDRRHLVRMKYPGLYIDELSDLVIYCLLFGHMPTEEEDE